VKRLFSEEGFEVKPIPLYQRNHEMGTRIRRRMIRGEEWESLVPRSVAEYIKRIDGVRRLREIARRD